MYLATFAIAMSSIMTSHATFFDTTSNTLYTVKQVYGGPLGNYLSHRKTAAGCGLLSLPFTTKIGFILGGVLGIGAGAIFTELTCNGDAADKVIGSMINIVGIGTLGATLGTAAGIPASYKFYQFLSKKMITHADKQVAAYTNTLTNAGRSNLLNHIKTTNAKCNVKSNIFQSNEQSFRNFMNILESKVVQ